MKSGIKYDDARVFAALDAQRSEVYLGEYMLNKGRRAASTNCWSRGRSSQSECRGRWRYRRMTS